MATKKKTTLEKQLDERGVISLVDHHQEIRDINSEWDSRMDDKIRELEKKYENKL